MPAPASEEKRNEWKNLIEQQRQSGLSIDKWCLKNQIRPHAFHYWKEKLYPRPLEKSSFSEMRIKRPSTISLTARGLCIRIDGDCDPVLRKQLFAVFAEQLC